MMRFLTILMATVFFGVCPAWAGPVTIQADHLDIWNNKQQAFAVREMAFVQQKPALRPPERGRHGAWSFPH